MLKSDEWQSGLAAVQNAFPNRDIQLKNAGDGGIIKHLFIGLACILIGAFFIVHSGNMLLDILSDRKMIDNYVVLEDAEVHGECDNGSRGKSKFINQCEAYIVTADQKEIEKSFSYIGSDGSENEVEVIAQKDNPDNISLNMALDVMKGRWIVLAFFAFVSSGVFLWGLFTLKGIPKKLRLKKIMNDPANKPWEVIAVPVEDTGDIIEYTTEIEGKKEDVTIVLEGAKPLKIGEEGDKIVVIAIKAKNDAAYIPLTNKYRGLDLKKAEKKQINDTIAQYF